MEAKYEGEDRLKNWKQSRAAVARLQYIQLVTRALTFIDDDCTCQVRLIKDLLPLIAEYLGQFGTPTLTPVRDLI
jgi:hypothetical protein